MATTKYYFLDPSCGEDFYILFERAQAFSARALQRLNDPTDIEFARLFELIFKASKTDTRLLPPDEHGLQRNVGDHVRRLLDDFSNNWSRTRLRATSDVRIHFEGLRRYVQDFDTVLFDPVNFLIRSGRETEIENFEKSSASLTGQHPIELRLTPENQHPLRCVIDFTELAQENSLPFAYLQRSDLRGTTVDRIGDNLIEVTLVHEMMHCNAYKLADFPTELGETAGWKMQMGLTKDQAYMGAESFAMLCLAAALADLGYTISADGTIIAYHAMAEDWILV